MSILGASGSSSNPYLIYPQSLQATSGMRAAGDTSTKSNVTYQISEPTTSQTTSATSSGAASLVGQVKTAIQNALNAVSSSQSNNPQVVLSSIEQAVQTTLHNNGIQPSQVLPSGQPHAHHEGHGGGGSAGAILSALASASGSSDTSSSDSSTASSSTSQTPGLDSLLSQLNVDPQQFRIDLFSALSNSQNGPLNQSQLFQSFPAGQTVNALA